MKALSACIGLAAACVLVPSGAIAQSNVAADTAVVATTSPTTSVSVAGLTMASVQALPGFPIGAYRDGHRQGRVVVEYLINPDGTVSDVQVLQAKPVQVFTRSATSTVASWRFVPTGASERRQVEFRFEGN